MFSLTLLEFVVLDAASQNVITFVPIQSITKIMLPVYQESARFTTYIYTSTVGAVLAGVVGSILLINVACALSRTKKNKRTNWPLRIF